VGIFSANQHNTMYKINLPISVFHIEDIFAKPHHIEMDWKIKSGKDMAKTIKPQSTQRTYQKKNHYFGFTKNKFSQKGNYKNNWFS